MASSPPGLRPRPATAGKASSLAAFLVVAGLIVRLVWLLGQEELDGDATRFDDDGRELAESGESIPAKLARGGSNSYIAIVAAQYRWFGFDAIHVQLVNLALSLVTLVLVVKTIRLLVERRDGVPAGDRGVIVPIAIWAFFPTIVVFSVSLLRESLVSTLIAASMWSMARGGARGLTLAPLWLLAAAVLHGPSVVLLAIPLVFVVLRHGGSLRSWTYATLAALGAWLSIGLWASKIIQTAGVDAIGDIGVQTLTALSSEAGIGGSAYSVPLGGSTLLFPVHTVLAAVYFLLVPMPWDVTSPVQALVALSSLVVLAGVRWAWRRRDRLGRPEVRAMLIGIVLFSVGFGVGSSNGGTAARHRTKVWPIAAVVVGVASAVPVRRGETSDEPDPFDEVTVGAGGGRVPHRGP